MSVQLSSEQHASFRALGVKVVRVFGGFLASYGGRSFHSVFKNKVKLAVLAAAKEST